MAGSALSVSMTAATPARGDGDQENGWGDLRMSKHQIIADGTGLHGRSIDAALNLLTESQSQPPSLSDIAEMVDVPEDSLRSIFPDPNAVLVAAAEQALVRLIDASVKAVVKIDPDDAVAQFVALGETYIDWASAHPAQFRLLSDQRILDSEGTHQLSRYIDSLVDLMERTLRRARDAGRLTGAENIPLMVLSSRAFVSGLASMIVQGRLVSSFPGNPKAEPVEIAKLALHDFIHRAARGSMPRKSE